MKTGKLKTLPIVVMAIALVCLLALWPTFRTAAQKKDKPATSDKRPENDSTRRKPHANGSSSKISDVDQESIDKAMKDVEKSMKELETKDWPNIQLEIENALKEVDAAKINREVAEAMKEVDMEKIHQEIRNAMKEVDAAKICTEVKAALKEVDAEKICAEVSASLKQVDWESIKKEMAQAQKVSAEEVRKQMQEVKKQMAHVKIDMKEQMKNANVQMKKAMVQLQLMKDGLQALEADGLIKKGEKVNIEYKNGILYLNDVPQSQQVSDKYKKYFEHQQLQMTPGEVEDDADSDEESNKVK